MVLFKKGRFIMHDSMKGKFKFYNDNLVVCNEVRLAEAIRTNAVESITVSFNKFNDNGFNYETINFVMEYFGKLDNFLKDNLASRFMDFFNNVYIDYEDYDGLDKKFLDPKLARFYLMAMIPGTYDEHSLNYSFVEDIDNLGFPVLSQDDPKVKLSLKIRIFATNYVLPIGKDEDIFTVLASSCHNQLPLSVQVMKIHRGLSKEGFYAEESKEEESDIVPDITVENPFVITGGPKATVKESFQPPEYVGPSISKPTMSDSTKPECIVCDSTNREMSPLTARLMQLSRDSAKHMLPALKAPIKGESFRHKGKHISKKVINKRNKHTSPDNWFPISKVDYDKKYTKELADILKEMKEVAAGLKEEYAKLVNNYKILKDKQKVENKTKGWDEV